MVLVQPTQLHAWHLIATAIASAGGWSVINKKLATIIRAMPPLPDKASWMQKWIYASAKLIAEPAENHNGNGGSK